MKRIYRTIRAGNDAGMRVWLNPHGRWTPLVEQAAQFEDDVAAERLRRLPYATAEDAVIILPDQENSNV